MQYTETIIIRLIMHVLRVNNIIIIIIEYHEIPTYYYMQGSARDETWRDFVAWMHAWQSNLTNKDMTQSCDLVL